MNKKRLIVSVITIVGVLCILVGSLAYYRITVDGSIKGTTGNAVFNVTGFTNESTKEITLKEGALVPGDKGEFTLHLDATNSSVDMYVTLSIDRNNLPTNLKFYTTSDRKSELHKYYEFMDSENQSKDITIYWYWNPYIDDEEDSNFINNNDVSATIKLDAIQISEYAMMKNGSNATYDETNGFTSNGTEFWNETYRNNVRMINFINDLSNLPDVCDEANLCWDISYENTQNNKVYAYLIDSGLDYTDNDSVIHDLYNLYIASEARIFAPSDSSFLFAKFEKLEDIDFKNNFNTSKVTNMEGIFLNCSGLTTLDLSNFNTTNVTNMSLMFFTCFDLKNLDIGNFNTSSVTDMSYMFRAVGRLISLDLSNFNTSNVTNMNSMFHTLFSTKILNISSFNTSNVIDMSWMFFQCVRLTSLDLSGFNTSNVTDMLGMFQFCEALTTLDLSSFNTTNVTNMKQMFYNCSNLNALNISSFNTMNVTNMSYMFSYCSKLTTTINIMSAGVTSYGNMFASAATAEGAQITVNYIADASTLVDNMISTKSSNSNVVKGSQL